VIDSIISKKVAAYQITLMDLRNVDKDFTPDALIQKASKPVSNTTLSNFFEYKIQQLKKFEQIGNSKVYSDTRNKPKAFLNNKNITFSQIDYNLLLKFESSLKADGLSDNGISVRMRPRNWVVSLYKIYTNWGRTRLESTLKYVFDVK
jgi:hypothetical protein